MKMSSRTVHVIVTILELLLCFTTLVTKKLTDIQSERILKRNQKVSNEWRLLNNLAWSQAGEDFSIVTYGGFTLITALLLFSRIYNRDQYSGLTEKLLLSFGALCFLLQGCLVYMSVEAIPQELYTNAFVLGSLSCFTAVLFLIDVCYLGKAEEKPEQASQTDFPPIQQIKYFPTPPILPHTITADEIKDSIKRIRKDRVDKANARLKQEVGGKIICNYHESYKSESISKGKPYLSTEI